jgi:hypothetical protein
MRRSLFRTFGFEILDLFRISKFGFRIWVRLPGTRFNRCKEMPTMLLEQLKSLSQSGSAGHDAVRAALSALPGVELHSSHRGTYKIGKLRAELFLHTATDLLLTARADKTVSPQNALETTHRFPGNLRYAIVNERLALLANVPTQPHDQLRASLNEIGQGLATACDQSAAELASPEHEEPLTLTTQQILDALCPLGWQSDSVVELPAAWELRPIVNNRPLAVKLTAEEGTLRLQHVVVARLAGAAVAGAVYDQALRLNQPLRHARLALASGRIVAEASFRCSEFCGSQLAGAARAVACAAHHTRSVLDILNTHAGVAACYATMFGCDAIGDEPLVAT